MAVAERGLKGGKVEAMSIKFSVPPRRSIEWTADRMSTPPIASYGYVLTVTALVG